MYVSIKNINLFIYIFTHLSRHLSFNLPFYLLMRLDLFQIGKFNWLLGDDFIGKYGRISNMATKTVLCGAFLDLNHLYY